jgi:hypothetical protein
MIRNNVSARAKGIAMPRFIFLNVPTEACSHLSGTPRRGWNGWNS